MTTSRLLKNIFSLSLLTLAASAYADCNSGSCATDSSCGSTTACCRASFNLEQRVGYGLELTSAVYRYDYSPCDSGLKLGISYMANGLFDEEDFAKLLAGSQTVTFQGTGVTNASTGRIIADNFGLSQDTNVQLNLSPKIYWHTINFSAYIDLDAWCNGLWLYSFIPVQYNETRLRDGSGSCDTSSCGTGTASATAVGTQPFAAGYMDAVAENAVTPATSLEQALGGDFTFGDMKTQWKYGRFCFGKQDDWNVANLHLLLGYNFYACPTYHLGAYIRVGAPVGTEFDAEHARNFFAPQIGNGHHWELGAGILGSKELYNCDDMHVVTGYIDGYVVHLFDECQVRTFDFKDKGCLSRYMLLKEFTQAGDYAGALINGVNYTTRYVETKIDALGELLLGLRYDNNCGWAAGLGYKLFGKTEEDICPRSAGSLVDSSLNGRRFGFKGCTPVEAVAYDTTGTGATRTTTGLRTAPGEALKSTASNATISSCGTVDRPVQNFATATTALFVDPRLQTTTIANGTTVDSLTAVYAQNSQSPTIITEDAIDFAGTPSMINHTIFGHIDYAFLDTDFCPCVGLGAEVTFASSKDPQSLNRWGVFVRAGLSF